MVRKIALESSRESLESGLIEQHHVFLDGYRRIQDGASTEAIRSLAANPEAFGMFQGVTQALCAVFSSLGRQTDEEKSDKYSAIRICAGLPLNNKSARLLIRQLDILRKTSNALYALVSHGCDRREMPTVPSMRAAVSNKSDVRGLTRPPRSSRPSRAPKEPENLPLLKFDGPYEEMLSLICDLPGSTPTQYRLVSRDHRKPASAPQRKSG